MHRMRFEGIEQINDDLKKHRSITVYLGHYCNWEWVCSLGLHITEGTAAQLYHPLESRLFDRLFLYSRERFKAHSIEMKEAFKVLADWQKEGRYSVTGYISDQVPGFSSMRRGYYVVKVVKICDNTKELPKFAITEQYYRLLETSIIRHPEFWLWSHNRWKRTREQFIEYFPDETERKRILSKL